MTHAAGVFDKSLRTREDLQSFWDQDAAGAARWLVDVAHAAGARPAGIEALIEALGEGSPSREKKLNDAIERFPGLLEVATGGFEPDQAARLRTGGWEMKAGNEPPAFTGSVKMQGEYVQLVTAGRTYTLASPQDTLRAWGGEVSAFLGSVVTVRGWPDVKGDTLLVQEFAPGSGSDFVTGRVQLSPEGVLGIRVHPQKFVVIGDARLSEELRNFVRVGLLLRGNVRITPGNEANSYRVTEVPECVYVLCKLKHDQASHEGQLHGDKVLFLGATPPPNPPPQTHPPDIFTDIVLPAGAMNAPGSKGDRRFVYGRIAGASEPLGSGIPRTGQRALIAQWASGGVETKVHFASEKLSEGRTWAQDITAFAAAIDAAPASHSYAPPPGSPHLGA